MAYLTCESCSGPLQIEKASGIAECTNCGKEYDLENLLCLMADTNEAIAINIEQANRIVAARNNALRLNAKACIASREWSDAKELVDKIELTEIEDSDLYLIRVMANHEITNEAGLKAAIKNGEIKEWEFIGILKNCDNESLSRLGLTKETPTSDQSKTQSVEEDNDTKRNKIIESVTCLRKRERNRIGETRRKREEEEKLDALNKQYTKAMRLFQTGKYQLSADLFTELGNIFDSKAMAEKSKQQLVLENEKKKKAYAAADAKMKRGKYREAATAFKQLEGYEDAAARARKARQEYEKQENARQQAEFNRAEQFMADKKFSEARDIYKRLGSFGHAKSRLQDAEREIKAIENARDYAEAEKLFDEMKYDKAHKAFKKLGSYSDSKAKSEEAKRLHEKEMAKAHNYQVARSYISEKNYKEAIDLYGILGDYRDSAQLKERAEEAYRKQKRKETAITAIVIAIIVLVVILINVGMFLTHA